MSYQQIQIHSAAPPKPPLGAQCNGCGVCCLVEPCPVGRRISGYAQGPCRAVQWHDEQRRYVCGMLRAPQQYLSWARCLPNWAVPLLQRWIARKIAAGTGCDADCVVE